MDWKSLLDDLKKQTDGVVKQAEAKYAELMKSADADGDGVPDRLEGLSAETKRALDEARAKVAELTKAAQDRIGGPKTGPGGTPDKTA
jgi:F0F1-type ATP synthase membrane subunit b/b'